MVRQVDSRCEDKWKVGGELGGQMLSKQMDS